MGRWAVEEIARRLADPAAEPRHEVLGPEFIEGNTTAPPHAQ
jgi:DNA-binding LacI/PurR family transcriptional regulator